MIGLVVRKCGMTRLLLDDGSAQGVTVLHAPTQVVSQKKTEESDGYSAIQVAIGEVKRKNLTKALAGHFSKAGVSPAASLKEFPVSVEELGSKNLGDALSVSIFSEGDYVDVRGRTLGCGFAGTVKRYNFRTQDASHGNSRSHRVPGSIGQNQTPGRVFKGKKMAGHMGNALRTIQSLKILRIDSENNLILVKGAVPGKPGHTLIVTPAVKKPKKGGVK